MLSINMKFISKCLVLLWWFIISTLHHHITKTLMGSQWPLKLELQNTVRNVGTRVCPSEVVGLSLFLVYMLEKRIQ